MTDPSLIELALQVQPYRLVHYHPHRFLGRDAVTRRVEKSTDQYACLPEKVKAFAQRWSLALQRCGYTLPK